MALRLYTLRLLRLLSPHSIALQYELEKSSLLLEQQTKEIELLRQQNTDLRAMMSLLQPETK
jgi:hypothetical protein